MIDTRIDHVTLAITVLVQIDCFAVVQKKFRKKIYIFFLLYLPCGKTELYKRVYKQCSEFLEKPNRSRGLVGQPRRIRRHFDCECSRGSSGESRGWRGHIPGRTHCDMLDRWASTNTEKKKKKVLFYSETNKAGAQISTLVLYNVAFWKNKNISRAHCCPMYSWMAKSPFLDRIEEELSHLLKVMAFSSSILKVLHGFKATAQPLYLHFYLSAVFDKLHKT